jgi:hypothetical protein
VTVDAFGPVGFSAMISPHANAKLERIDWSKIN